MTDVRPDAVELLAIIPVRTVLSFFEPAAAGCHGTARLVVWW